MSTVEQLQKRLDEANKVMTEADEVTDEMVDVIVVVEKAVKEAGCDIVLGRVVEGTEEDSMERAKASGFFRQDSKEMAAMKGSFNKTFN